MTEDQIFDWFHQILDGVNHLHKHQIYHRYLKPQNILIAFDGVLKIVDLGISINYEQTTAAYK